MSLFSKKPLSELMQEAESGTLRRSLGAFSLTTLGIGAVIGAGIFVITGTAAAQFAGPALVISMLIAGVGCAFAGLCYAEFASMIPVAGSAYTYAYATLGELFAWIIGWDLILEYALGASTIAVGWAGNVQSFLQDFGLGIPAQWAGPPGSVVTLPGGSTVHGVFNVPAALVVLAISVLLIIGIRESAGLNTLIVIIKVVVLLLFVAFGAAYINRANWHPFVPPNQGHFGVFGWSGVLRGAGVIFFAFIGFDAVSTAAQEAKNPQRDMPIGIMVSLVICTILYVAVALVLTGIVKYTQLNVPAPIALGIDATGIGWLKPIVKLGAIMGLTSTMLVMLLGQPRIFYSMSRDGLLPPLLGKIHPRFRTPYVTTAITGVVVAFVAGLFPIAVLTQLTAMGTLLAFVMVCMGVLVLRKREPHLNRPFKTPGMPWVPIAGALICFAQMVGLPGETWARLVIWLVIGLFIYFFYGRHGAERMRESGGAAVSPIAAD
ncbi:MAG TPA: amino acid permease [Gemmatimonadaceae bacterium]|nr:amino acid permease [Gemmatimonadaceae bacterium]